MDFVSLALTTLKQPTGMWESILNSFKSGTGSYIWAVILVAVLVRILFSLVDILNKKVSMKTSQINEKMKPELEAIQKKYGHDQRLLQQKTNELYKKYQFNMMGSCFPMLLSMVLQFTVFLTLWNSLQAVSNFNIAEKYENMKNVYANVLNLRNDENAKNFIETYYQNENYTFEVDVNLEENTLKLIANSNTLGQEVKDYELQTWTNEEIYGLLTEANIIPLPAEENPEETTESATISQAQLDEILKTLAQETAEEFYLNSQESFMWIKNIYKADSPSSPLFTKSEIKNYLSSFYTEDEKTLEKEYDYEGQIFDYVVTTGIGKKDLGANGYYILTIIAVLVSFFSMWLSNFLMKGKNKQAPNQSKMMYFIMPIIFGIFTFMYTSLFAIYIIVGQLVMVALTPLTTFVVKKWVQHDANKKKEKEEVVVDYRRKDK